MKPKYTYNVVDSDTDKPRIKEDIGHPTRASARESKQEWSRWGIKTKIIQKVFTLHSEKVVR